ncbi:serine/threonine-protein kinase [Wenzhouxiangella sp. XN201]|uniref:protein kinase domain-containing protein n=1 Tax=Wenzhouxiangella sp. XN201 TaxID=2710755 RepID=UPI0013DA45EC
MNTNPLDWETGVPLASGGSAEVVRAWCPSLGRDIAVKYLKAEDPGAIARLVREAETQKGLEHPHILRVHQTGVHLGRHYIAMDLVEGKPIDQALEGADQDARLAVFEQVLAAVALAHERGVTHRDLKPANILVEEADDGPHAWVMDFGLARQAGDATLTVTGHAIGTPGYMAPEQARGEKHIDARADIFALGVILYRLFTGSLPFDADTPVAMMLQAASGDIAPISGMRRHLPEGLVRIVAKCLEYRRTDRYDSARKLLADIHAFRTGQVLEARRIGRLYSLQRWSRRNPALALTGLAAIALVTASAAAALWSWQQSERDLATARGLIASAERVRSDWYIDQMRPPHDQAETRQQALATLDGLERETRRTGPHASAEVHSAMADLHYELGDYADALKLAESAWQAGLRQPATANRATRSLLRQYNEARIQRSLSVDPELLPELDHRARSDLLSDLAPYRDHLPAETDRLVRISLGEREGTALEWIEGIEPATPDDWDTLLILAQHQTAEAGLELMREQEKAAASIKRIDSALANLIDTARSSAAAHLARCQLAAVEANPLNTAYDPDTPGSRERIGHCGTGLAIRSEDANLLAAKAYWLWQTAKRKLRAREDYVHLLDEAIELAGRALKLAPDNHPARLALGTALQLKGRWAMGEGQPESEYLERALDVLQQAHEEFPGSVNIINNLAVTWTTIATSRNTRGNSIAGEAAHEEAIRWMQRAAAIRPDDRRLVHNAMATEIFLMYDRQERGLHRMSDHDRLDEGLEALIERYPDYATPYNSLALLWWGLAEFQQRGGEDPQPALARAENVLRRLLAFDPDHESGLVNLAGILRHQYRFSTPVRSERLERAADEAMAIYRRLERPEAERQEFGCLIAEILAARAHRQPPDQQSALLTEAERLSRTSDNIDWLKLECLVTRAEIAINMSRAVRDDPVIGRIWEEIATIMAERMPENAALIDAAARLAWSLNKSDLAAEWSAQAAAGNPQFPILSPAGADSAVPTP